MPRLRGGRVRGFLLVFLLGAHQPTAKIEASIPVLRDGRVGECNPVEGPGLRWTRASRTEARARVLAVFDYVGASEAFRTYAKVIGSRESSWMPGVWHDGGRGLGAMGLMISAHHDKWPGDDENPAFCWPEVSALVALEVMHRAVHNWHAGNLVEIQAIYSGRFRKIVLEDGTVLRAPGRTTDPNLCARLARRGVSCLAPITAADLGRRVPKHRMREVAAELAAKFEGAG